MGLARVLRRRPGPAISGDAAELFVGINVAGDSLACQQKQEIAIGAGDAVISDPGGRRVHRTAPRTVPAFEPHPASTTAMITSPAPRMSLVMMPGNDDPERPWIPPLPPTRSRNWRT